MRTFDDLMQNNGYTCAISHEIMVVPFTVKNHLQDNYPLLEDGTISTIEKNNSFEYQYLKDWLAQHQTHPNTREPLSLRQCYINFPLMHEIEAFVNSIRAEFPEESAEYLGKLVAAKEVLQRNGINIEYAQNVMMNAQDANLHIPNNAQVALPNQNPILYQFNNPVAINNIYEFDIYELFARDNVQKQIIIFASIRRIIRQLYPNQEGRLTVQQNAFAKNLVLVLNQCGMTNWILGAERTPEEFVAANLVHGMNNQNGDHLALIYVIGKLLLKIAKEIHRYFTTNENQHEALRLPRP